MPAIAFQRPSPADLREAAPTLLQAGLALALVIQAARLLWIAFAPLATAAPPPPAAAAASAAVPPLASHGDVFFPRAARDGEATGYTLLGVRMSGDGGSAILARNGAQVAYALGDTVAPGITLAGVAADHVLLRAGGRGHRVALAQPSPSTLQTPP